MKRLPEVAEGSEALMRMVHGAIASRLLLTAVELKVFSQLSEPMTAEALARRMGTHPENTRRFLDALAANDLLRKRQGRYENTPVADAFLVEERPTYLGDVLMDSAKYMRPALEDMTALVKDGPRTSHGPMDASERAEETRIYANYQRAGRAQSAAAVVSGLPEFPRMAKMLDLGGGAGLIGMAIVAAHPSMTGVVFDRPEVVGVAREFIRQYEMEGRMTAIGGDFATDSIGDGYDLVWTSFALRRGNLEPVLRKVHAALAPGGVCVSLAEGLTDERTRPAELINSMLSVILSSHDPLYEEGEVSAAMLRVGFRSVHSRIAPGPQPHGPMIMDIARK